MGRWTQIGAIGALCVLATACSNERLAVITVEDPGAIAVDATAIAYGLDLNSLTRVALEGRSFPVTFAVRSAEHRQAKLWVEAWGSEREVLARGQTPVVLRADPPGTATVSLVLSCDDESDCDDESFCTGEETCTDGMCQDGPEPCQSSFECVASTCDEMAQACVVAANHDACPTGTSCTLDFGCIPCSPSLCQPGEWCDDSLGRCLSCDDSLHCGPDCVACSTDKPTCAGRTLGCVCDPEPGPRGSCGPGSRCSDGECVDCVDPTNCGQECGSCDDPTPTCGGPEAGCVVDAGDCTGKPDFARCQVTTTDPADRSHDVCVNETCISPGCAVSGCNPPGPGFQITDTNERLCFDTFNEIDCPDLSSCDAAAFCGQDAQYGWDTEHAGEERYARTEPVAGEATVEDTVSGLVWQGCAGGQADSACTGGVSGFAWAYGLTYCQDLVWAGYFDWRLPDYFELQTIVDAGRPFGFSDSDAFPNTPGAWFWSSTLDAGEPGLAWAVSFDTGEVTTISGSRPYSVRCVRAGYVPQTSERLVSSEVVGGEPVVQDHATGLVWQGTVPSSGNACDDATTPDPNCMSWQDALFHCHDSSWGGHTDWLLPSYAELASIVDVRNEDPAIDVAVFPATPAEGFWTSTTYSGYAGAASAAWLIDFSNGYVSNFDKGDAYRVRCTRSTP